MNELVRLTTQDVSKAIPITDTKVISENIGINHRHIKKHLLNHKNYFEQFGLLVVCETESTGGRPEEIFCLNEQQATFLITLLKNTEEVTKFKFELVKAFFRMKNELQARVETRHIGIYNRKLLTDAIRDKVDEGTTFKSFAYSNYSKLVYKKVLGETVKSFKERNHIPEKDNVRNHMTVDQLDKVQEIESKIATYLEIRKDMGETDKQIYEEIKNHIK